VLGELASLRTRIDQGPDDPSTLATNQISLVLVQSRLLSLGAVAETGFQVQLSAADVAPSRSRVAQLGALDATRTAAVQLQGDLQQRITDLAHQLRAPLPNEGAGPVSPVPPARQPHLTRRNQLQSEIAPRAFELRQLEATRDLYQHTYDLLRSRHVEQQVNQTLTGVVAITAPATREATLRAQQPEQTFALLAGVALGIGMALAAGVGLLRSVAWPGANSNAALCRRFHQRLAE